MPGSSPGGKCWFGIDLKTFEIIIEDHKGKERTPFRKFWSEGDRAYSMELRSNRAGRFLFCVVRDAENKRFSLTFPEGRGLVGGWKMLASKLRSMGVAPLQWRGVLLDKQLPSQDSPSSSVGRGSYPLRDCLVPRDAVWLEIEKETLERNEELLGRCLVGSWVGDADRLPDPDEAERVYSSGTRRFRGRSFCLEKWRPSVGCLEGDNEDARQVWVRILGLPLHLWERSLFKQFGDSCERYVAVDENTAERRNLKWARVLVETSGWQHPSSLQVVAGASCYALQLWWEEEPCLSSMIPACRSSAWKIGDEVVAPARAMGSVDPQPPSSVIL
ncbi:hypothetical protein CK203_063065 [Vitis vinifera]|uniref:Uncharacterized protein n=1 Tax=Vitis vinifera TaxID=29760 RepID=A0A438G5Z2_VITVI|nr:hypothetical protein CK203_063065 [Vitis vinifera]